MLPENDILKLKRLAVVHLRNCIAGEVPWGPKHHLFIHLADDARAHGNPKYCATFMDESINRVLASVSMTAYASVWERRVYANFQSLRLSERGALDLE